MTSALLFPGQGSQQSGMRDLVATVCPELLMLACELVGEDPFEQIRAGTVYQQPAVYCASVARLASLDEHDFYAGHSLGEIAALVAAGSLSAEDGLRLVVVRARLMQRVADEQPAGAMLAVEMGVSAATRLARALSLTVANDNSPSQTVLSGGLDAIEAARSEVRRQGLRACRLQIKGAFHERSLECVVPEFHRAMRKIELRPPRRPVLSGVTAREFDDIPRRLAEALTQRVRWRELLLALHRGGVDRFIEAGPGRVLTKLVQETLPRAQAPPPAVPIEALSG